MQFLFYFAVPLCYLSSGLSLKDGRFRRILTSAKVCGKHVTATEMDEVTVSSKLLVIRDFFCLRLLYFLV